MRLTNYAWVEQELKIPNLPPSWVTYLESLTVAVSDAGPAPDAPAAPAGDPVASQSCTGQDIFGITVWNYNSYVGFSTSNGKITNMSLPNDYFHSDYGYSVSQPSWQTSQPGPPTASMTGQDGTNLYLATVPYGAISIEYHFSGNGSWGARC